jgi:AraC-like DNA-binding protein
VQAAPGPAPALGPTPGPTPGLVPALAQGASPAPTPTPIPAPLAGRARPEGAAPPADAPVESRSMRMAKQYINANYAAQITLDKVAAYVGFNPTYFSTLFKKECGQNFLEYLSEVRVTRACDLLRNTNQTVASICKEVGYRDLKHFIGTFKRYAGLKPNEYRKLYS